MSLNIGKLKVLIGTIGKVEIENITIRKVSGNTFRNILHKTDSYENKLDAILIIKNGKDTKI